jgi:hypothetical protein
VSGHIQTLHFTALELEIAIDHPVGEYATGSEEATICVQCIQGLLKT